jgi:cytochrome c biogenesis protein CcdA
VLPLALLVASIGLADSVNPSTLAPALFVATGRRGEVQVARFTLGVFAVSFVGGLVIVIGPGQLIIDALPHPGHHAKNIAEVIAGAILLVLAGVLWARRRRVSARLAAAGRHGGRGSTFLLGAGIMAVELPTAFPYFAAIAAIVASRVSLGGQVVLLLVFNVAFVTPLLAILALRGLAQEHAERVPEGAGDWLRRNSAALAAVLLALLGAVFVGVGVVRLV